MDLADDDLEVLAAGLLTIDLDKLREVACKVQLFPLGGEHFVLEQLEVGQVHDLHLYETVAVEYALQLLLVLLVHAVDLKRLGVSDVLFEGSLHFFRNLGAGHEHRASCFVTGAVLVELSQVLHVDETADSVIV